MEILPFLLTEFVQKSLLLMHINVFVVVASSLSLSGVYALRL